MSWRRVLRTITRSAIVGGAATAVGFGGYIAADEERRKTLYYSVEGRIRYVRSLTIAILIGLDYSYHDWAATSRYSPFRFEGSSKEEEERYLESVYEIVHERSAERLLKLISANGGIYIKGGQYLSAQNHVLPKTITSSLAVLQDRAPVRPIEEVYDVLSEEFGRDPKELVEEFEETPIAAASLAQVHRAKSLDGKDIVMKVMYKGINERFEGDMNTFRAISAVAAFFFPQYDSRWVYDEIYDHLKKEMNFITEAENARRAEKSWKKKYWSHSGRQKKLVRRVTVPEVYDDLTTQRVLTMEYIDGCKINDFEKIKKMGLDLKEVASLTMSAFADQIFIDGFFHADPHPGLKDTLSAGNVFVRKNEIGGVQLVVLDHGLYREIGDDFRLLFCRLWKAMVMKDEPTIKEVSNLFGVKHYKLFAMMLMFRDFDTASIGMESRIKSDEFKKMREFVMSEVDMFMDMMRAMPKELLLVIRNNNYLRSLNMDMGAPVNRFRLFATAAVQGLEKRHPQNSSSFAIENVDRYIPRSRMFDRLRFEVFLEYHNFVNWLMELFLRALLYFGYTPGVDVEAYKRIIEMSAEDGEYVKAA